MNNFQTIEFEQKDDLGIVWLNRPKFIMPSMKP